MTTFNLYDKNTITGDRRYTTPFMLSRTVSEGLIDEYLEILSDQLMLDELLYQECSPVEYLKECIIKSELLLQKMKTADKLQRINDKLEE